MDIIKKVGDWAHSLTQTGLSVLALGIILEILFGGVGIPFWPDISVVDKRTISRRIARSRRCVCAIPFV
jgi:hypothetical protein